MFSPVGQVHDISTWCSMAVSPVCYRVCSVFSPVGHLQDTSSHGGAWLWALYVYSVLALWDNCKIAYVAVWLLSLLGGSMISPVGQLQDSLCGYMAIEPGLTTCSHS